MKIRNLLIALLAGWVIPGAIFAVTEQIHLSKAEPPLQEEPTAQQTEAETEVPIGMTVSVIMPNGVVEQKELNDYITEVVLGEMPASFEIEALKAQAIVARTYTLRHMLLQDKHDAGCVCTDSACCQTYCSRDDYLAAGHSLQYIQKVEEAVAGTGDKVLTYEDALIDATYFSCAGDRTEDALAVWGTDVPYLQSVESPGEEISDHYVDSITFSSQTFMDLLGRQLQGPPEFWIGDINYTTGGGVDTIIIGEEVYKGTELRQLLGLRSTDFQITALADSLTITTKGYGHRVGMSQYGAQAMALQGNCCEDILSHYYPGTRLETWHDN